MLLLTLAQVKDLLPTATCLTDAVKKPTGPIRAHRSLLGSSSSSRATFRRKNISVDSICRYLTVYGSQVPNPFLRVIHMPGNDSSLDECQYYLQDFERSSRNNEIRSVLAPHNARARKPQEMSKWPTDTLFDYIYGIVALRNFGLPAVKDVLREHWGSKFHSSDVDSDEDGGRNVLKTKRASQEARKIEHYPYPRYTDGSDLGTTDAMLCLMLLRDLAASNYEENLEDLPQEVEEQHRKQSEEKVVSWLEGLG